MGFAGEAVLCRRGGPGIRHGLKPGGDPVWVRIVRGPATIVIILENTGGARYSTFEVTPGL